MPRLKKARAARVPGLSAPGEPLAPVVSALVLDTGAGSPLTVTVDTEPARRYLEETGLFVDSALVALVLERDPQFPYARGERLTPEEHRIADALGKAILRIEEWARGTGTLEKDEVLSKEEEESVQAADLLGQDHATVRARLAAASPTYRQLVEQREALDSRCRLTADELRARIAAHLTRSDGTVAPSPAAWCAHHGIELERFTGGVYWLHREEMERTLTELREERARLAEERERLREQLHKQQAPPLRLPTRAAKTLSLRERDKEDALRRALNAKRITKAEYRQWMEAKAFHATGDELLVVAGLLHYAKEEGRLRTFEAASARVRGITLEARLPIVQPNTEELCRVLGFSATASGTVSGSQRRRVQLALESLREKRRIIVRQRVRVDEEGQKARWENREIMTEDMLVKRSTDATGAVTLELHPCLADGYWWGHLTLHLLPQQWDSASRRIGVRKVTDSMKWGDFYFRRLAVGVVQEWITGERRQVRAELEVLGLGEQEAKEELARRMRARRHEYPDLLEKTLKTATVLESVGLLEYRAKEGAARTRKEVDRVLAFAVEVEDCPLIGWTWDGEGSLPGNIRLTLKTPPRGEPEPVQEELFPALALGDGRDEEDEDELVEVEE